MAKSTVVPAKQGNTFRTTLGFGGAIAAIVGLLILIWPGHTAVVITAIIAIYAIISGLIYLYLGGLTQAFTGWTRLGHLVLGAVFVLAGIISFFQLGATTATLFTFVGILVGILWIIEGIVTLTTLSEARSKAFSVVFAVLSFIAGISLLLSPLYAVVLWIWLGVALLVLGVMQIIRALSWKSGDQVG